MSGRDGLRRHGLLSPVNLMLMALVILVGCIPLAAAMVLYSLHSTAEATEAEQNANKIAHLLLRSFEQVVEPLDSLLQNFANSYEPTWTPQEVFEAVRSFSLPASVVQISVVDKEGVFITSNLSPPTGQRIDLSDREHIRVHIENGTGDGELFISKPVLGRVSKKWTIQFTRPLHDGAGHFAGVVVASYNISDFIEFYKGLRVEDGQMIALIGLDGIIRARAAGDVSFGEDVSGTDVFRRAVQKRGVAYHQKSPLDGVTRIGYVVRSERYPIMVFVGFSEAFVRSQTEDFRTAIFGTAVGLFCALLLVFLVGTRYLNLQRDLSAQELKATARQREAKVLDAISRVPGVSVLHVTADGPSEVGASGESALAKLMRGYLRSGQFRAFAAGLKGPGLRNEHLSDGETEMEVEVVVAPLEGMEAKAPGQRSTDVVVFAVDQTSRRMEENKLYQMSKLASLGEVATGLAHEINQPLGVIRLAASNALTGMKRGLPPEHLESKLNRIIQQTVRMSRIIDHMRIFGRKSDPTLHPFRAAEAVEGALQVVGAQFRLDNIEVTTTAPEGLPDILCRQDQLEQVLINLLQNARDAINDRRKALGDDFTGRIRIEIGAEQMEGHPWLRISVADNGGGIPEGVIERIFQPFFTTKPPGKGTGLGLSVSFGIIRDHGGSFSVANDAEGAVFAIRLPGREAEAPRAAAPASEDPVAPAQA